MNDLKQKYSELNDNALLNIVYFESSEYTEEAIQVAKSELAERGLSQPSEETLQKAKEYIETPAKDFDGLRDGIKKGALKEAVKKRDYFFIGEWLFGMVIFYALYSVFQMGMKNLGSSSVIDSPTWLPTWMLFPLEFIFNIAIFGLIPVIFFCIYSLRLSKKQRKEKKLVLFMPKYVFFVYGISLLIFLSRIFP